MIARKPVRTTVAIPADLLTKADEYIRDGWAPSRAAFIEEALRRELKRIHREHVDAEFRKMAEDRDLQAEHDRLTREFATADAEAWALLPAEEEARPA